MAVATASFQRDSLHDPLQAVLSLNAPFKHTPAFPQISLPHSPDNTPSNNTLTSDQELQDPTLLVTSPYTTREHLLDLKALQPSQQLLAKALTVLEPIDEKYATSQYASAFNWPVVTDGLRALSSTAQHPWMTQSFYIVVFRSQLPPTTDRTELGKLDEKSHAEANKSGGLLKYWFGIPDAEGRNLATCVWRDFKDARPASSGDGHKAAARATIRLYTEWKIERLRLTISDDGEGGVKDWDIEAWTD